MTAILISIAVVALAEIGDKTQLLAIVLAARFKQPRPIIFGILVATLVNHFLAAAIGSVVAAVLDGQWFRYLVAASFVAMAGWALIPDSFEKDEGQSFRFGAFLTTLVAFFLVEMGDKTQIATIALAARFESIAMVAAGTTIGMLIANAPAVLLGERLVQWMPMRAARVVAALLFLAIGLWLFFQMANTAFPAGPLTLP